MEFCWPILWLLLQFSEFKQFSFLILHFFLFHHSSNATFQNEPNRLSLTIINGQFAKFNIFTKV